MSCLADIIFTVSRWNIPRFNKVPMPVRRALGWFAERCLPRGMKGRGFLMRHGKTLEERYFANATNIFTEREANKILKKGCEPQNSKSDKTIV